MWSLNGSVARYEAAGNQMEVDLGPGTAGIHQLVANGVPLLESGRTLLQIDFDSADRLDEAYLRGDDVVASYATRPGGIAYQAYWRILSAASERDFRWELVLSVQTQSLDSQPAIVVCSTLPSGESETTDHWSHAKTAHGQVYLEMIHPSNHDSSAAVDDRTQHQFFGGQLEKGVIRRARIQCIAAAANGLDAAAEYAAFSKSPPPLTT